MLKNQELLLDIERECDYCKTTYTPSKVSKARCLDFLEQLNDCCCFDCIMKKRYGEEMYAGLEKSRHESIVRVPKFKVKRKAW